MVMPITSGARNRTGLPRPAGSRQKHSQSKKQKRSGQASDANTPTARQYGNARMVHGRLRRRGSPPIGRNAGSCAGSQSNTASNAIRSAESGGRFSGAGDVSSQAAHATHFGTRWRWRSAVRWSRRDERPPGRYGGHSALRSGRGILGTLAEKVVVSANAVISPPKAGPWNKWPPLPWST